MSSRQPPREPARPRRADRPTAPAAARTSVRAAGRAIALMATEPRRRRAQRRARIALGRAVAAHLAGQPAPPLLATPLAAHRAAQLRLASTDPPPRPSPSASLTTRPPGKGTAAGPGAAPAGGSASEAAPAGGSTSGTGSSVWSALGNRPAAGPPATGAPPGSSGPRVASRAGRSARRDRDLAAELERLLMIVVQFLPRLAAKLRLRAADERLGAWATGLSDPQDPVVAAARTQAAEAQRAAVSARVAASANWRQAVD
ncbi:MAG TPA: hypothetical protein VF468_07585, partial [Actinomycetota bacterium]|nr:hypothetical protein [Actinomycetota bacterium]